MCSCMNINVASGLWLMVLGGKRGWQGGTAQICTIWGGSIKCFGGGAIRYLFFLDTILGGSIKKGKGLSLLIYHCLLIHDRLQVMIAICCSLVPWCDNHITGEVVWRHIGIPPWPHLLVTCGNIVTWPFRGSWLKKAAFKFWCFRKHTVYCDITFFIVFCWRKFSKVRT